MASFKTWAASGKLIKICRFNKLPFDLTLMAFLEVGIYYLVNLYNHHLEVRVAFQWRDLIYLIRFSIDLILKANINKKYHKPDERKKC